MKPLIITAALTGAGSGKKQAPAVPVTPEEIAEDVVAVAKAGAAVAHIHVRGEDGFGTMDTDAFEAAVNAVKDALKRENLDIIINLTTSGGEAVSEVRMEHLKRLRPEMCSFDAGTMNWANAFIFENHPVFLAQLGTLTQELNIKPEIEIFDGSMIGNAKYYIKKGFLKPPCHFQFVLGVPGGLALGADGVRVGLEDNVYYAPGEFATNAQLVERAVRLAKEAGREVATAARAREILGIKK